MKKNPKRQMEATDTVDDVKPSCIYTKTVAFLIKAKYESD